MNLETIESEVKTGQVSPHRLAEMKDWLAGESSYLMDKQLALQIEYATFYDLNKPERTDKGVLQAWRRTANGQEEMRLDTRQKKIKVLREAISSHLKVADNAARNLY